MNNVSVTTFGELHKQLFVSFKWYLDHFFQLVDGTISDEQKIKVGGSSWLGRCRRLSSLNPPCVSGSQLHPSYPRCWTTQHALHGPRSSWGVAAAQAHSGVETLRRMEGGEPAAVFPRRNFVPPTTTITSGRSEQSN
jgi:hypothetical protein